MFTASKSMEPLTRLRRTCQRLLRGVTHLVVEPHGANIRLEAIPDFPRNLLYTLESLAHRHRALRGRDRAEHCVVAFDRYGFAARQRVENLIRAAREIG